MADTKPYIPPPEDSSPTPVIEMGFRSLNARLLLLASRLDSNALIRSKNLEKLDLKKSRRSKELANEVRRLAELVAEWPDKPSFAIAGQKNYVAEQYIDIMREAEELIGGKVF